MQTNISVPNIVTVYPSKISGSLVAPASKSSMQRACAAALVRKGISIIHNPGVSNDDIASLNVIKTLGAKVEPLKDGSLKIDSTDIRLSDVVNINFGESGLGIRMFTPIAALAESLINISGEGSLTTRPMDFFDEILPQLGVQISSNNGKLPLQIKGALMPKNIEIDGSLSSQFLTGLLLSYAASLNSSEGGDVKPVTIKVNNLKSKPYIDLTLKVMQDFGLPVPENKNYEQFIFHKSQSPSVGGIGEAEYTVEGDWSGGAFLLVAGAIAGGITVSGLDINSTQADKKILEALKASGCGLSVQGNQISIVPPLEGFREAFSFDANDCPDLFPPLVALASYCNGVSAIAGVERLTHKESNRALTLQEEFAKLGIEIILDNNLMKIKGGAPLKSAVTHSRHDHRIAMACAVAALGAEGAVTIEEAAAIKKSYPNFYTHLAQLGVTIL